MRSSILVSRIMRVIETDGQTGDGAGLAAAFAEAIKRVNARMESVQAAEASEQVSEAVRLMEDPPRILEEINALDFNCLPDWEALCRRSGWQSPPPLDRTMLEKILMFSESKAVCEPFLRMYRKAVRTNNNALAVSALRRLVETDSSQNWEGNLVQAEAALQRQLAEQFSAARASGDEEAQDRLAREILDSPWRKGLSGSNFAEVLAYWNAKEARRRDAEGRENIALLGRCRDENWNRTLAMSMLKAIDLLVEQGWTLPQDAHDLIDECRRRVAEEVEAEKREQRWKNCCEALHSAIQREDTAAIREAMAAPEFLDREPTEDLVLGAKRVILHEEVLKQRRIAKIVVGSLAALAVVLSLSGWWLRQKLFDGRCEGEAAKFAVLAKGAHAIERMGEALKALQKDAPDVYDDPRVNVYAAKFKTMVAENLARTNEVAGILATLSSFRDSGWTNSLESVTGRFARVEALLTSDDAEFRARCAKLKMQHSEAMAAAVAARREEGTKRHEVIVGEIQALAARLLAEADDGALGAATAASKENISKWREDYGALLPELEGQIMESERQLLEAEQRQKNFLAALETLKTVNTAPEMLEARKSLMDFYTNYPAVLQMKPNPVDANTAKSVLEGSSADQKKFAETVSAGIPSDAFKAFLKESVATFAEIPSFYSLYGLTADNDSRVFAFSRGKPSFKKLGKGKTWQIDGDLLDADNMRLAERIEKNASNVHGYEIASVDEVRSLVDIAGRPNLTIAQFENEVLKLIEGHLAAIDKNYVEDEQKLSQMRSFSSGRYMAYRRIQMLNIYFALLKDELKLMPPDAELLRWTQKVEALAQPVKVVDIPDDLSWVCVWDPRVRSRNAECLRLLKSMPPHWVKQYREWRSARSAMRGVAGWKVETAGRLLFDPRNEYLKKNPDAAIQIVLPSVAVDHPLYVMRKDEAAGRLLLDKALVPQNGRWFLASVGIKLIPGEPLYQVCRDGKAIDADAEIGKIVKTLPPQVVKVFVEKIPFFKVEVEK